MRMMMAAMAMVRRFMTVVLEQVNDKRRFCLWLTAPADFLPTCLRHGGRFLFVGVL